jgi:hypothetical protein
MPTLAPALLTMFAAQLLDLGTFMTMIRRLGPSAEANPLVVTLLGDGGMPLLVLLKLGLVVLVGAVAVALLAMRGRATQRLGWAVLGCAIAAGIVGGWSNALTIGAI